MPTRPTAVDGATVALLILPPLFWAGNAIAGRLAVGLIPPLQLNLLRWFFALVLLAPFAWTAVKAHRTQIVARWKPLLLLSILSVGCYNSFQYLALQTSTPINVTLIAASGPAFILALGALFFRERATRRQILGAAMSICGVFWVMLRGDLTRLARIDFAIGDFFMLAATLAWALYTWFLRKRSPQLPELVFLAVSIALGVLVSIPFAAAETLWSDHPIVWNARTAAILAYVSVFPSLVALACWNRGVARAGAQLPMYFSNLTPLFAAVMSALWLAELPQTYHFVALVLIVAGIKLAMPNDALKRTA